jgi:excisionase family DNA binding protein
MPALAPSVAPQRRTVTKRDASIELGVSIDHLDRLIARGELPVVRVPGTGRRAGRILILRTDLEAAIEKWRGAA